MQKKQSAVYENRTWGTAHRGKYRQTEHVAESLKGNQRQTAPEKTSVENPLTWACKTVQKMSFLNLPNSVTFRGQLFVSLP